MKGLRPAPPEAARGLLLLKSCPDIADHAEQEGAGWVWGLVFGVKEHDPAVPDPPGGGGGGQRGRHDQET